MEAGVYSARSIGELDQQLCTLAGEGFRIISVIDTHNDMYHVVAQKDFPVITMLNPPNVHVNVQMLNDALEKLREVTGVST